MAHGDVHAARPAHGAARALGRGGLARLALRQRREQVQRAARAHDHRVGNRAAPPSRARGRRARAPPRPQQRREEGRGARLLRARRGATGRIAREAAGIRPAAPGARAARAT